MNINEKIYLSAFQRLFYHFLHAINFWRSLHGGIEPLAVQVVAAETGPVVSHNDAVGIKHRNYFEDKSLTEYACIFILAHEKLDEALNNEGGIGLARMHPRRNNNGTPLCYLVLSALQVGDYEHFNTISSNCTAHLSALQSVFHGKDVTTLVKKFD